MPNLAKLVEFSAEPDTCINVLSFPLGVYSFLKRSKMQKQFSCGSVLESELINRNGDMVKLVSSEKNLRFKGFYDRLLQQERKEPA